MKEEFYVLETENGPVFSSVVAPDNISVETSVDGMIAREKITKGEFRNKKLDKPKGGAHRTP